MLLYHHICADCNLDVVTDYSTLDPVDAKACICAAGVVETVQDTEVQ